MTISIDFDDEVLAQSRPSGTSAISILSPSNSTEHILIKAIYVCNTTASSVDYRIFLDNDGETYDQSTSLFYDVNVPANTTEIIEVHIPIRANEGNLAVRTETASALTFTVIGRRKVR